MAAPIALSDHRIRSHPKGRPQKRQAFFDALAIQRVLLDCVNDPDASYADKAKAALAWERLEERKRILRNRPLPGSLKPEPKSKTNKRQAYVVEPVVPKE